MNDKLQPLSFSFMRLYMLAFIFFAANSLLTILLPLRSKEAGVSEAEIGVMMGAYMLTCMLLRPLAAQYIGRYGPLLVMKWLLMGHAAVMVLYLFSEVDMYLSLRALQGAVTAFFSMTMQSGIVENLNDKDRAQGLSMYTLFTMVPSLFIPMAAMQIWETGSDALYIILMIVLAAAPLLIGFRAPLPQSTVQNKSYTILDMLKSISGLWRSPSLMVSSTVMLIGSCVFGATATFLPLYMVQAKSGNAGLFLMIQGLVIIICRFTLRKKIPSDGSWNTALISGLLLAAALGTLLLALLEPMGSFVYLSAISLGFATALLYPTLTTYLSFVLPEKTRYILMGLFMSSYDLGYSLGGLVMGIVVQYSSYAVMFSLCSLLLVAAWLSVILNKPRMERAVALKA